MGDRVTDSILSWGHRFSSSKGRDRLWGPLSLLFNGYRR